MDELQKHVDVFADCDESELYLLDMGCGGAVSCAEVAIRGLNAGHMLGQHGELV